MGLPMMAIALVGRACMATWRFVAADCNTHMHAANLSGRVYGFHGGSDCPVTKAYAAAALQFRHV